MSNAAIRVENLSKRYRIGLEEEQHETLAGAALAWLKSPVSNYRRLKKLSRFQENGAAERDVIWALKDVSFEVEQGEVVGIIGRNGAGKSTLLKILSHITEPTSGRAVIQGRVSSLLEVGTGFHKELTGRENVYLNGTVLGMNKAEVDKKFDEIVAFSGVETFIDTPVKRYSSGMKVRLAFAVAAHLEPEVLLIDEVLAVGDVAFQKKCLGKMDEVAKGGRTVLFVSHQMDLVIDLCPRCILLDEGQVDLDGASDHVVGKYLNDSDERPSVWFGERDASEASILEFLEIYVHNESGEPQSGFSDTEGIYISVRHHLLERVHSLRIKVRLTNERGEIVFTSTDAGTLRDGWREPGEYISICKIPQGVLNKGTYSVYVFASIPLVEIVRDMECYVEFSVERLQSDNSKAPEALKGIVNPNLPSWTREKVSRNSLRARNA